MTFPLMKFSFAALLGSIGLMVAVSPAVAAPSPAARAAALSEFTNTCSRCHNSDGSGYANMGMPNFTDPQWQAAHSDAERTLVIRNGVTGRMPPFGTTLSSDEIDALLVYV